MQIISKIAVACLLIFYLKNLKLVKLMTFKILSFRNTLKNKIIIKSVLSIEKRSIEKVDFSPHFKVNKGNKQSS